VALGGLRPVDHLNDLRRVEVEADDVADLLDELRVGRQLRGFRLLAANRAGRQSHPASALDREKVSEPR
jgi:hypothetical protein